MSVFSDRTNWDLSPNPLTAVSAELKSSGVSICDLTVSNPTRCGFQYFQDKLFLSFSDPMNVIYDPDPKGLVCARQAVAEYYRERGVIVPLGRIFLTASTSEAYGFLFRLLANPGESVVFPKPSYPLFEFLAGIHDLDWRTYTLVYQGNWILDQQSFQASLDGGAKAIILVNPNNPTGSCLNPQDLQVVTRESSLRDIPIICDEVFLDYGYTGQEGKSLAGNQDNLTFVLGGLSKSLALPQMKCSWIVISGPEQQAAEAVARLEIIADTYLSVNTPVQNALTDWMKLGALIRPQIASRICQNRKFLVEAAEKRQCGIRVLNADGGWSAVVRFPCHADEESFVLELLKKDHVFVHPGYFFDFAENGHVVLSLLPEETVFREGVERMLKRMAA